MKKGISGDLILQIGIVLIASITTVASVNIFYDAVETAVLGDPTIAAKTLAIHTDFVESSSVPIKIYHEIPTDFLGNPGYGTILFNPVECEYTLSKYPQDYMSSMILNSAWDTISIEEAVLYGSLYKYNKQRNGIAKLSKIATEAGQELSTAQLIQYRENQYKYKQLQQAFSSQGYDLDEVNRAIISENANNQRSNIFADQDILASDYNNRKNFLDNELKVKENKINQNWDNQRKLVSKYSEQEILELYPDKFDIVYDKNAGRYRYKAETYIDDVATGGRFLSNDEVLQIIDSGKKEIYSELDEVKRIDLIEVKKPYDDSIKELNENAANKNSRLIQQLEEIANLERLAYDEIDPNKNPLFNEALEELYQNTDKEILESIQKNADNKFRPSNLIPGVKAYRNRQIVKTMEKSVVLQSQKVARKGIVKRSGIVIGKTLASPWYLLKAGGGMIKSTAIESSQRAKNRILFVGSTFKIIEKKAVKEASEQTSKRIGKTATRSLSMKAITAVSEPACGALLIGAPLCVASIKGMAIVQWGLEFAFTYLPIIYFINKSQKASETIEDSFSKISCKSKEKTYFVSKPNCKSKSVLNYPEFDSTFLIGDIQILEDITEGIFAMPSSSPIFESKTYKNIINSDNNCVDSHNNLLSKKAIPEALQDTKINPRETVATIPFMICGTASLAKASFGPGCTAAWSILYLGSWAAPEVSNSFSSYFAGTTLALFAGPGTIALTTAFLTNPIDSKSFFPYISKSAGIIDSDNNYYIENALVVEISKKEHNGKLITEINKVL
jgi:hypothetical protein